MVARACVRVHRFRSLGLLFLSLVLVLTLASSVASQDSDTEEPFAEAPPREWATGAQSYTVSATYDDADRPLTYTTPTNQVVTYTYDGAFPKTLAVSGQGTLVHDLDYNIRGQLEKIERGEEDDTYPIDTTLLYYGNAESFRLDEIQHGIVNDAIPNFLYNQYDDLGNIEIVQMKQSGATETLDIRV